MLVSAFFSPGHMRAGCTVTPGTSRCLRGWGGHARLGRVERDHRTPRIKKVRRGAARLLQTPQPLPTRSGLSHTLRLCPTLSSKKRLSGLPGNLGDIKIQSSPVRWLLLVQSGL